MKKEKVFYAVCIMGAAVAILNLIYIIYAVVKTMLILNAKEIISAKFWTFSQYVIISNAVMAIAVMLYLLLRRLPKKTKDYVLKQ